jgi:hypothetical protein
MKYLKKFQLFESNYTFEEYTSVLVSELGKYNMSAVEIRDLIERLESDIKMSMEDGIHPLQYSKTIIDDLDLPDRGKNGWNQITVNNKVKSTIKYL